MRLDPGKHRADKAAVVVKACGPHRRFVPVVQIQAVQRHVGYDRHREPGRAQPLHLPIARSEIEGGLAVAEAEVPDPRQARAGRQAVLSQPLQTAACHGLVPLVHRRIVAAPGNADLVSPGTDRDIDGVEFSPVHAVFDGHVQRLALLGPDRDCPAIHARRCLERRADGQPEPPRYALADDDRVARHHQPRLDRVDRTLHRHAADAIGDKPGLDARRGDLARPRQVLRRHRHRSQVAQREQGQRQRFQFACHPEPGDGAADLVATRPIVVKHVLHVVPRKGHIAALPIFGRRLDRVARRRVQDAAEVVVKEEPPLGDDAFQKTPAGGGLFHRIDHHRRDATGPVLAAELKIQLAIGHRDVEFLLLEVSPLILVERVVLGTVLDVPEAEVLLLQRRERQLVADGFPPLGQHRSRAVHLVLAPEPRRTIQVDEHMVRPIGHIDRQPALLDAQKVLIQRIRLQGVERPPHPGVLQAVPPTTAVQRGGIDPREARHQRALRSSQIQRDQPVELELRGFYIAFETQVVQVQRSGRLVADIEHQVRHAGQQQLASGTRFLADIQLIQR